MAGAFELMAKTADFSQLSKTMAETAAQLAKAKAEADKQSKKAEEAAMAKIDDFLISDRRKYTQKFQPMAQQAMVDLIDNVAKDKKDYPNTWVNLVNRRMIETEGRLVAAEEQSIVQRDIIKKANEGYMVPAQLLKAYNSNYGKTDDIIEAREVASRYGIDIAEDGSVAESGMAKPISIRKKVEDVRKQKGAYTVTEDAKKTGQKVTTTVTATLNPGELDKVKKEFSSDMNIRRMYQADDERYKAVTDEMSALKQAYPEISEQEIKEMAITNVIESDVENENFNMESERERIMGNGINIRVGEPKARVQTIDELTYVNQMIGGKVRAGVNARDVWQKQGSPERRGSMYFNTSSKIYDPQTGIALSPEQVQNEILNRDVYVNDVYNKDGVPMARVTISLPTSAGSGVNVSGITEFEVELNRRDALEQSLTGLFGDLLKPTGKTSVYDYVRGLSPVPGGGAGGSTPRRDLND